MASLPNSRSVWFTTLLIFLFFWNIFHNAEILAPPPIEVVEETPEDLIDEDYGFIDPPQPDIYEPELAIDVDDDYFTTKPSSGWKGPLQNLPPTVIIEPPGIIVSGDMSTGADADANALASTQYIDITPPNAQVDTNIPVDPIITYSAHKGNTHAQTSNPNTSADDRPLVLYAYTETAEARVNLEFFAKHGLQSTSDFVFVFNGVTDAHALFPTPLPINVRIIFRQGGCHDLGAQAEVLLQHDSELVKKYKRFVLMNASVRGPFSPSWSKQCWVDTYIGKLAGNVKVCPPKLRMAPGWY